MKTIEQVESQFEQKVQEALRDSGLLPEGFKPRVRFHGKTKDKKNITTAAMPSTQNVSIYAKAAACACTRP